MSTTKKTTSKKSSALRKKAEKKLDAQKDRLRNLSAKGTKDLVHELGTHQIELEMQNEELRGAQEELEASRNRYIELYDLAPTGYFTFDKNGAIREVNLTGAQLLGVAKRELLGKPFLSFVAASDRATFRTHLATVFVSAVRQTAEIALRAAQGAELHVRLESVAADDRGAAFCRTALSDVTDRRRAENALRESENLFRLLAERSSEIIFQLDLRGLVTYVSPAISKYGFAPREVAGVRFSSFVLAADLPGTEQAFLTVRSGEPLSGFEARLLRRDGSSYPAEISVVPIRENGVIVGIQGVARDITERKRMDEALRSSEALFRTLTENSPDCIALHDAKLRHLYVNPAIVRMSGLPRKAFIGKTVQEVGLPRVLADALDGMLQRSLEARREITGELTLPASDGQFHFQWKSVPLFHPDGSAQGVLAIANDITARKNAEDALRESEERFKAIAETTAIGIGVIDAADNKFLYANSAYQKSFGYTLDELLDKSAPDVYFDPADRAPLLQALKDQGSVTDFEVRLKRKDGTAFWGASTIRPISFGGRPALLGAFVDITERRRTEEEIKERMAELQTANEDLARFNRAAVDRELRMIELKREVNELLHANGKPPRYPLDFGAEKL